jgi:CheY-like chemotaxis protein
MNDPRAPAPIPRILVVDANDDTRELYRQSFQRGGCHVVEASDGRDALTQALASPPSLVVTEIRLPFLDGCALCEILRRDWATADIPILVVTTEATEMERARRAGADIVVAKLTTPDHILSLARRLLTAPSRFTRPTPATPPVALRCPSCDRRLAYDRSHIGGVSDRHREHWHYYTCPACGAFQYRQRTRKLRRVDSVP